jgi:hypothetical protein
VSHLLPLGTHSPVNITYNNRNVIYSPADARKAKAKKAEAVLVYMTGLKDSDKEGESYKI